MKNIDFNNTELVMLNNYEMLSTLGGTTSPSEAYNDGYFVGRAIGWLIVGAFLFSL